MLYKAASKRRAILWLRLSLSLALVAILSALLIRPDFWQTLISELISLPLHIVGSLFLLSLVMRALQTIVLKYALSAFELRIRMRDCAQLLGLKGIYNMGISGGGIAAQLAQSRITLGIKTGQFIGATLLQAGMFISSLLFILGSVLLIIGAAPFRNQSLLGVVCFVCASAAAGLVISGLWPNERIRGIRALAFLHHLRADALNQGVLRPIIFRIYLYSIGIHVARSVRFTILLSFMAAQVSLEFGVTAVLVADVVAQLPVTPAGLGTRELALGYFGEAMTLFDVFLAAAIIDRTVAICFNIAHGLLAFLTLSFASQAPKL